MRPNITITIPTPYLPIDEYCRITGTPMGTARDMVRDGRLPIRGKGDKPRARVEMKWHTEFGHLNRGDMLTSEQHRCSNEKKKFQRRV